MKKLIVGIAMVLATISYSEEGFGIFQRGIEAPKTREDIIEDAAYSIELGEYEKARIDLDKYIKGGSTSRSYILLTELEMAQNRYKSAKTTINKGIKEYPENLDLIYKRIEVVEKQGEVEKNAWRKGKYKEEYYELFEEYLKVIEYQDSEKVFILGDTYFKDGYYEKAMNIFTKDVTLEIRNMFGAATTMRFLGKYRQSERYYTMILGDFPEYYEAYIGRASARQMQGKGDLAVSDLEEYLSYNKELDIYIAIANIHMKSGKYSNAKEVLERARRIYPSSKEVRELLVEVYSKTNG